MVERTVDERKVIKQKDGTYKFTHYEVQIYPEEAVEKMLDNWKREKSEQTDWLKGYDDELDRMKQQSDVQLNAMRQKINENLESLEEGLELWLNPETEE